MVAPVVRPTSAPDAWPKREDGAGSVVNRFPHHLPGLGRSPDQPNETGPTAPYQWLTFVGSALSM